MARSTWAGSTSAVGADAGAAVHAAGSGMALARSVPRFVMVKISGSRAARSGSLPCSLSSRRRWAAARGSRSSGDPADRCRGLDATGCTDDGRVRVDGASLASSRSAGSGGSTSRTTAIGTRTVVLRMTNWTRLPSSFERALNTHPYGKHRSPVGQQDLGPSMVPASGGPWLTEPPKGPGGEPIIVNFRINILKVSEVDTRAQSVRFIWEVIFCMCSSCPLALCCRRPAVTGWEGLGFTAGADHPLGSSAHCFGCRLDRSAHG